MKYLLDVNVLLAAIHQNHPHNARAKAWLDSRSVVLCPLTELGFLRISTHRKALAVPMALAEAALETFVRERKADWIPDDISGLAAKADKSEELTDRYLAQLASKNGYKLATLDEGIQHSAVELIS